MPLMSFESSLRIFANTISSLASRRMYEIFGNVILFGSTAHWNSEKDVLWSSCMLLDNSTCMTFAIKNAYWHFCHSFPCTEYDVPDKGIQPTTNSNRSRRPVIRLRPDYLRKVTKLQCRDLMESDWQTSHILLPVYSTTRNRSVIKYHVQVAQAFVAVSFTLSEL